MYQIVYDITYCISLTVFHQWTSSAKKSKNRFVIKSILQYAMNQMLTNEH